MGDRLAAARDDYGLTFLECAHKLTQPILASAMLTSIAFSISTKRREDRNFIVRMYEARVHHARIEATHPPARRSGIPGIHPLVDLAFAAAAGAGAAAVPLAPAAAGVAAAAGAASPAGLAAPSLPLAAGLALP